LLEKYLAAIGESVGVARLETDCRLEISHREIEVAFFLMATPRLLSGLA
jgi:hypothetical protein